MALKTGRKTRRRATAKKTSPKRAAKNARRVNAGARRAKRVVRREAASIGEAAARVVKSGAILVGHTSQRVVASATRAAKEKVQNALSMLHATPARKAKA
jgi:hypothetical protein